MERRRIKLPNNVKKTWRYITKKNFQEEILEKLSIFIDLNHLTAIIRKYETERV